jgi:uncharacterized protein (DUF3820 family)
MSKYRVLVGLDYPPGKRAEAGDVVADLPEKSVKWLDKQGLIEPADSPKPTKEGDHK